MATARRPRRKPTGTVMRAEPKNTTAKMGSHSGEVMARPIRIGIMKTVKPRPMMPSEMSTGSSGMSPKMTATIPAAIIAPPAGIPNVERNAGTATVGAEPASAASTPATTIAPKVIIMTPPMSQNGMRMPLSSRKIPPTSAIRKPGRTPQGKPRAKPRKSPGEAAMVASTKEVARPPMMPAGTVTSAKGAAMRLRPSPMRR